MTEPSLINADHPFALHDATASRRADAVAIASGRPGFALMHAAGAAVAAAVQALPPAPVLVVCGPGSNGGDGCVAAALLAEAGWPVRLAGLAPRESMTGDAARAAAMWAGAWEDATPAALYGAGIIVDALFGCGLNRPVEGQAAALIKAMNRGGQTIVSIDLPSGIDGDTGSMRGAAVEAALTVALARARPGHVLEPGRTHAGRLIIADIGHPREALIAADARIFRNDPALWPALADPMPPREASKYTRGEVFVAEARMRGASILAATAAIHAGAGAVALIGTDPHGLPPHLIHHALDPLREWDGLPRLKGPRAIVYGPGLALSAATRRRLESILAAGTPLVLDAGGLSAHEADPAALFRRLHGSAVLTPHQGEFDRLLPGDGGRMDRVRAAAARAGCTVVLKGADTLIADPHGRIIIQPGAPASLASAGSGDVLAGAIAALMVQAPALPPLLAAAAGVFVHAAAAAALPPGFAAGDLAAALAPARAAISRAATAT